MVDLGGGWSRGSMEPLWAGPNTNYRLNKIAKEVRKLLLWLAENSIENGSIDRYKASRKRLKTRVVLIKSGRGF